MAALLTLSTMWEIRGLHQGDAAWDVTQKHVTFLRETLRGMSH